MLSLNTASRTCRLELKLHGPKFARLQLSFEDALLPERVEICRATFARTDQGGK